MIFGVASKSVNSETRGMRKKHVGSDALMDSCGIRGVVYEGYLIKGKIVEN